MLSFALPQIIFVNFLREPKKDNAGGYEAVPLTSAGDDDDEDVVGQSGAIGRDNEEGDDLHKRRTAMV